MSRDFLVIFSSKTNPIWVPDKQNQTVSVFHNDFNEIFDHYFEYFDLTAQ